MKQVLILIIWIYGKILINDVIGYVISGCECGNRDSVTLTQRYGFLRFKKMRSTLALVSVACVFLDIG